MSLLNIRNIKFIKSLAIIILGIAIQGCAKTKPRATITWAAHKKQIEAVQIWAINGKISATNKNNSSSALIHWQQSDQDLRLKVYAPIGGDYAIISQARKGVYKLELSSGELYFGKSPEDLMQQHVGWHFPISGFKNWVKGIPSSKPIQKLKLNDENMLEELVQDNWTIKYAKYRLFGNYYFPTKIEFLNKDFKVKVFIKKWNI